MLVDKLSDVANLAMGALFLGQFLSERPFVAWLAFRGVGAWLFLLSVAVALARGGDS